MARSRGESYARAVTSFVVDNDTVEITQQVLGRGCSCVYKATVKLPNGKKKDIAAKKIQGICITARNEIETLKKLKHENIIKYFRTLSALNKLDTYILMEIAHKGDLYHYIRDVTKGPVPITKRWRWILQSAWAIQYLHSEGLVHRDIKSPNFLIMDDFTLKLGDFGLANEHRKTCTTGGNGTYNWIAPEVLIKKKRSKKSDVYSYGTVVREMQTGETPFKGMSAADIVIGIHGGMRLSIPSDCPPHIKQILQGCLEEDYTKRLSMDQVLQGIPEFIIRSFRGCPRNPEPEEIEQEVMDTEIVPCYCKCKRCQWMKTDIENQCCENNDEQCLSCDPKIEEFLDSVKVSTKLKTADSGENENHSRLRRNTYRKFVAWRYGRKGCGNRVPIPSCVVCKIRERYPDSNNFYVGFSPKSKEL